MVPSDVLVLKRFHYLPDSVPGMSNTNNSVNSKNSPSSWRVSEMHCVLSIMNSSQRILIILLSGENVVPLVFFLLLLRINQAVFNTFLY